MLNSVRFGLSGLFLVAGLFGYYSYPQLSIIIRSSFVLLGAIGFFLMSYSSSLGLSCRAFLKDSYREILKVVWPTRKETIQATILVMVFCFILAVYLWFVDYILSWIIYGVILGWK